MLNLEFSEIIVELGTAESESSVYCSFILLLSVKKLDNCYYVVCYVIMFISMWPRFSIVIIFYSLRLSAFVPSIVRHVL